ncbi:MAG TPA: PBP1A family penicillin-binding protein [Gemmatimonadaceae bacterium]|jgi:penicillin-binding protein 1A|nr:PBP1A family penicillin-binding protein [Gemmatimonadaceae bacterium]
MAFPFTRKFRERHPGFTRGLALMICFLLSFGTGFAYASWSMVCRAGRCPSATALQDYEPRQTSKLYAVDGRFIAELGLEKRTIVHYNDIPPLVRNAFISVEDKRFFHHAGVDWHRVPGAMLADLKNRNFEEGFSTITMQLARNIFPERISSEKSIIRKLKEIKVARDIEARYPKDKILELYLNQINLGNGAYGIESAAQRYFGKSIKDLNVAEAATLGALPKGPTRYNPRLFPDRAVQRRNTVIAAMRDEQMITPAEASEAQAYPLRLATRVEAGEVAPYFVEWIRQQLDDKFGRQLYEQGLKVYTTLDLDLQSAAERSLERQIRAIEDGRYGPFPHTTYERYVARASSDNDQPAANAPYLQGAFIAMDPTTGGIRALVGGRDFDDSKFNRAVQAVRQPGSTFKPIVYADAIQNGRPLSYILDDSPLTVQIGPGDTWTPQNYESDFTGKIPMRRALYQSRNVPTIRLGIELGTQSVIDEARKFGLTTPIPGYPSIFIGAADVYPIELVAAYTTFATLGTRAAPIAITRVEDQKGNVLWEPQPETVPVMSPEESWLMVSVMKDVVQRGTAASSVGSQFHYPAGGKTGTTNDGTNVWFVGYTSDLVAGVWMGFDKPQKIKANAQGGVLAAPAWTAFMTEVYKRRRPPRDWPMPGDIVTRQIDFSTNMLATQYCPRQLVGNEFFIPGTDPILQCDVHTGGLYPDTSGIGSLYPPGTTPPPPSSYPSGSYPIGGPPRNGIDTGRVGPPQGTGTVVPGQVSPIQPGRAQPRDSSRRFRDSSIFSLPPRDSTSRPRPRDSVRVDTIARRPRPDTTRPDTLHLK